MNDTSSRTHDRAKTASQGLSEIKRTVLETFLRRRTAGWETRSRTAIPQRVIGEPVPLSFSQEQVWLHMQMAPELPIYNESITICRYGSLDLAVLKRCFAEIIRRHEIWRTTFDVVDEKPLQVIHPATGTFRLDFQDLCSVEQGERAARVKLLAEAEIRRPFDLRTGPLVRALALRTEPETYSVFVTFHQIVFDSVSAYRIFLPELAELYAAFSLGRPSPLPEPQLQYADFASWQRKQSAISPSQVTYWRQHLAGELPSVELPVDRPRPAIQSHRGQIERFSFSSLLIASIRALSQQMGTTFYMTLLAALVALLHRYTNQDDITLGGFSAGRRVAEIEQMPGYFVNPIPLRFDVSGDPTFAELLSRVRLALLNGLANEEVPFAEIAKAIPHRSDPSRNPLFQVVLSQQPKLPSIPEGWNLVTEEFSNGCSKLDLIIVLDDRGENVFGPVTYNPDLFEASTIQRMITHWKVLLEDACHHPQKRMSALALLTEEERHQIVVEWNNTHKDYGNRRCLHEIIECQAEKTPQAIALKYENEELTYAELNERANQVAHFLRSSGVRSESLVGIAMERSVEMVVGLLGTLKAGAGYLPFDPDYPKERLRMMLDDSRTPVVLTQQHLLDHLPDSVARKICLDSDRSEIATHSTANPCSTAEPHNIAYAIYTSGSTGRPKGVLNIHSGIVNRLLWMQEAYKLTSDDRVLQKTPYSFDVSVWEFFWPLMTGACLVIARPDGHKEVDYLVELIQREKITTIHFVPSMLQIFLDASSVSRCTSLRRVICSGEALPAELQRRFFDCLRAELHNLYGPTEAAVDVTYWQCMPHDESPTVPIGRPIANMKIHILDRNLEPVPIGIAGELHIGGVGLARGYLNRPELTKEKFIPDPFGNTAARLYKTGDLARYRADGNIEFLGRIDDQVKIHGIRIELGEVEAVIRGHEFVRDARVTVRDDPTGSKRLIAYVVLHGTSSASLKALREYLNTTLPGPMVPSLVCMNELPLNANGKLDRKSLPTPEPPAEEVEDVPAGPVESILAELWKDVLGLKSVGVYDNFIDLGGDSLSAVKVVARLHNRLGLKIRTKELAFQSLRQLAASCNQRLQFQ